MASKAGWASVVSMSQALTDNEINANQRAAISTIAIGLIKGHQANIAAVNVRWDRKGEKFSAPPPPNADVPALGIIKKYQHLGTILILSKQAQRVHAKGTHLNRSS